MNPNFIYNAGNYGANPFQVLKAYVDKLFGAMRGAGKYLGRTIVADANYQVQPTDHLVAYTSLSTGRSATLPATGITVGQPFIVKDEAGSAGANNITVVGTIDGATNKVINSNYGNLRVYWSGSTWFTW